MPYIPDHARRKELVVGDMATNPGELNFQFTHCLLQYIKHQGLLSYQTINDIIGALEQAKDEFRRQMVHPYEDTKRIENGDVYGA